MSTKRPNVVLVLADQWRPDCLSALGHPDVQTPRIDALAKEGVIFNQTVTQSPVCVPARACLFSGRYPHQLGILKNGSGLWPESPNFVRAVRDAGYQTANRGKLHLFWRHDNELLMSDFMHRRFGFTDPLETTGKCSEGRLRASAYSEHLRGIDRLQPFFRDLWLRTRSRPLGVSCGPSILNEENHIDAWLLELGREYIAEHANDPNPYFLWLGPPGPHDPFDPPDEWATRYDPTQIKDVGLRQFSSQPKLRERAQKMGLKDADDAEIRRMRALYYGNISMIDYKIGHLVDELKKQGRYDDTWIIVTADHGEFLGDYHLTMKSAFHRVADQVPLVIKPPASYENCPRGLVSNALVELIDVGTTIREISGGELDGDLGKSLLPMLSGSASSDQHRSLAYSQLGQTGMARDERFKIVFNREDGNDIEAFYDLQEDPQELNNLAESQAQAAQAMMKDKVEPFFERTSERWDKPWKVQYPFQSWGRYVLGDSISQLEE